MAFFTPRRVCWKQSLWKGADAHVPPSACPPAAGAAGGRPAALALAAGFAWRSTPVPVQNTAYAFACPRSVSVQTQGDRSTFWVKGTQVGGIDCYPALPWETLTQGLWTVPLPTGTLAASDPLFSAYLLECSALGQPVTLQEAGGRTHTLYFSPAGACYDLWLDPGSPAPADLSAIRASFTLL
ncbi:hypothetical protein [Evtepia sp.]|uniref:hypothetical protein n=1 Tax=Evtepia sp. TaxID=2773933 RepID=UPI002E766AF0|nr:hypothetical protein [Evtepia sp.]MEE0747862.1 hypothetical protein [Evtepia sp.]